MSEDDQDKDHAPSQKKLDDARQKGDVARSADLTSAVAMAGLLLAALIAGKASLEAFGNGAMAYLDGISSVKGAARAGAAAEIWGWAVAMTLPFLPFLALPGLAAALCLVAQRAVTFSGEKLAPRLSRIDPLANARQKFGREGMFEFAKSAAKLVITAVLLGWFVATRLPRIMQTVWMPAILTSAEIMRILVEFMAMAAAVSLVMGGADFIWQYFEHIRRNRMSHQELREEFKDSEGDPQVKSQRRRRAIEIASNRMLLDVPTADVVIVNPTHFAVALKWNRNSGLAPVCVAKGVDELAARIREAALAAGVPIHSDPPTARALHATTEIGQEVGRQHFAPVAAAIRYAERMRKKASQRVHGR